MPTGTAVERPRLPTGTVLTATYKGTPHTLTVIEENGEPAYQLDDGRVFKTPTPAGKAITGSAVNGWAFWKVSGTPAPAEPRTVKRAAADKSSREYVEAYREAAAPLREHENESGLEPIPADATASERATAVARRFAASAAKNLEALGDLGLLPEDRRLTSLIVSPGERIYYTGDMANQDDWGTVESVAPNDVVLKMDSGRTIHAFPTGIGATYDGTARYRFVPKAAYDAYREKRIAESQESMRRVIAQAEQTPAVAHLAEEFESPRDRPQRVEMAKDWARQANGGLLWNSAIISLATGRWDDVVQDVRDGRLSAVNANAIISKLEDLRVLAPRVADDLKRKVEVATPGSNERKKVEAAEAAGGSNDWPFIVSGEWHGQKVERIAPSEEFGRRDLESTFAGVRNIMARNRFTGLPVPLPAESDPAKEMDAATKDIEAIRAFERSPEFNAMTPEARLAATKAREVATERMRTASTGLFERKSIIAPAQEAVTTTGMWRTAGDTYPHRRELRAIANSLGGRWNKKEEVWEFPTKPTATLSGVTFEQTASREPVTETAVDKYIGSIRNAAKRKYAERYVLWLTAGGSGTEPWKPTTLSAMGAQSVRHRLQDLTETKAITNPPEQEPRHPPTGPAAVDLATLPYDELERLWGVLNAKDELTLEEADTHRAYVDEFQRREKLELEAKGVTVLDLHALPQDRPLFADEELAIESARASAAEAGESAYVRKTPAGWTVGDRTGAFGPQWLVTPDGTKQELDPYGRIKGQATFPEEAAAPSTRGVGKPGTLVKGLVRSMTSPAGYATAIMKLPSGRYDLRGSVPAELADATWGTEQGAIDALLALGITHFQLATAKGGKFPFYDEQAQEAVAPEGAPKTLTTRNGKTPSLIGTNWEGKPVYANEDGVRSVLSNGIASTEAVRIVPTRSGMTTVVDIDRRGADFKTTEELAAERTVQPSPLTGMVASGRTMEVEEEKGGELHDYTSRIQATEQGRIGTESRRVSEGEQARRVQESQEGRRPTGLDRPESVGLPAGGGGTDLVGGLGRGGLEPGDQAADLGVGERLTPNDPLPAPISIPQAAGANLAAPSPSSKGRDLVLDPASDLGHAAGAASRFDANLAAISTLKAVEARGTGATPEEQAVIGRFSGWGDSAFEPAFKAEYFYDDRAGYGRDIEPAWKRRHKELKELTTPEEFEAIERERLTAFFTTPTVINAMWRAVDGLGINAIAHPRILEPSAGSGRFFGLQPTESAARSMRTAVELDTLTGRMLKQTYPNADVYIMGYQQAPLPNDSFDLAISNVPFGARGVVDPAFRKGRALLTRSIHNYFFAKTLDKLRPGGVLAFVTSAFTLNSPKARPVREALAEQADFLGAIRLPKSAFPDTQVTTDIVFMRKRLPTEEPGDKTWVDTETIKLTGKSKDRPGYYGYETSYTEDYPINSYFLKHPEMVLGEHSATGSMHGGAEYTVEFPKDGDLGAALAKAITRLPVNVLKEAEQIAYRDAETPTAQNVHDEAWVIDDNGALFIKKSVRQTSGRKAILVPAAINAADQGRVKGMLAIRDAARTVLDRNLKDGTPEELAAAQQTLNAAYDAFVSKHGPLGASRNAGLMEKDPDGPFLRALELWGQTKDGMPWSKEETRKMSAMTVGVKDTDQFKMPIFNERVVRGLGKDAASNPADAMRVVLNRTGRLDFERMGALLDREPGDVQAALFNDGAIYRNPAGDWETADKYLSGDVRQKLREAKAAVSVNGIYEKNVQALEAVQPVDIPASQISVRLGSPWVPSRDVSQFVGGLLDVYTGYTGRRSDREPQPLFRYVPQTGAWIKSVGGTLGGNQAKMYAEWGTERMDAGQIIERMLNGKPIEVTDPDPMDESKRIRNPKETLAAQEKGKAIEAEFERWLWSDQERAERLTTYYNETYNNIRPRVFDGSHLVLPGMDTTWFSQLHKHQRDAIWRITQDGTVGLGHEVGFGKTAVMVASAMELRRMGLSRKNLFVVPKATHQQFANQFREVYPYAKILFPVQDDFSKEGRPEFLNRIVTGDWDAVILSYEQAKSIPIKPETEAAFLREQVREYRAAIEAEAEASEGRQSKTSKELQDALDKFETRLGNILTEINEHRDDNSIHWEDLGVDQLYVDEADSFKALPFATKLGRLKGIPNGKSQRAEDMYMKVRYQQGKGGGRGVVFATGTPVANTLAELYTQMRYLQEPELERRNLQHFDAWQKTFGETTDGVEATVQGTYRPTTRFARFVNIPELSNLWQMTWDIRVIDEVPEMTKRRPRVANDDGNPERTVVSAPPDQELIDYMAEIVHRAESLKGMPEKGGDNMLKISGDARKASLDMRLVDPTASENKDGKVAMAITNIARIYRETTPDRGVQLVFLDMGTPKVNDKKGDEEGNPDSEANDEEGQTVNEFLAQESVYAHIKSALVRNGLPPNEVAFIHDAKTDRQREMLFDKVNAGAVRVLIGSTSKMGAGVNVQKRAAALHHLDAPWRPRDIEQREGRIVRQGNIVYGPKLDANGEVVDPGRGVRIYEYVTVRSFDEFMWQAIEVKAKAIKAIMKRNPSMRVIDDIDPLVMTASEAKAIASGNPDVLKRMVLTNELNRLELLRSSHRDSLYKSQNALRNLPDKIAATTKEVAGMEKDVALASAEPEFSINVKGSHVSKRPDAAKVLNAAVLGVKAGYGEVSEVIGKFKGFDIRVRPTTTVIGGQLFNGNRIMVRNPESGLDYETETIARANSDEGVLSRLENLVSGIPAALDRARRKLAGDEAALKSYTELSSVPFTQSERLVKVAQELAEVEKRLQEKANSSGNAGVAPQEEGPEYNAPPPVYVRRRGARQVGGGLRSGPVPTSGRMR